MNHPKSRFLDDRYFVKEDNLIDYETNKIIKEILDNKSYKQEAGFKFKFKLKAETLRKNIKSIRNQVEKLKMWLENSRLRKVFL